MIIALLLLLSSLTGELETIPYQMMGARCGLGLGAGVGVGRVRSWGAGDINS